MSWKFCTKTSLKKSFQVGKEHKATHYTVGEKKDYYRSRANNKSITLAQQLYAAAKLNDLTELTTKRKALGDVFVVNDVTLGAPVEKPRRVAIGKLTGDKVLLNPFYPSKGKELAPYRFNIKAQENTAKPHSINLEYMDRNLRVDDLFERNNFDEPDTCKLTKDENLRFLWLAKEYNKKSTK